MGPRTCNNTLKIKEKQNTSDRSCVIEAVWRLIIPKIYWKVCATGFVKLELLESLQMEALISNTVPKIDFLSTRWLLNWANL